MVATSTTNKTDARRACQNRILGDDKIARKVTAIACEPIPEGGAVVEIYNFSPLDKASPTRKFATLRRAVSGRRLNDVIKGVKKDADIDFGKIGGTAIGAIVGLNPWETAASDLLEDSRRRFERFRSAQTRENP